ncbi:GtrA family protein, partial [Serratia marcescens]|uniref:GtrA family protein n=1 Tax=Serratia marcescens TaxID=615 RepID=UPI0009B59552
YWYYDRHRSVRLVILVGLAIDQIAQSGLSSLSVIYYSAQLFRLLSFMFAVVTTWVLNRNFTFDATRYKNKSLWLEFIHYLSLMSIGGIINIVTYSSSVMASVYIGERPIIGVAIGSVAGMSFNFLSSKIFIYIDKDK